MTCSQCQAAFNGVRSTARFCSASCRVTHFRETFRARVIERQGGICAYVRKPARELVPDEVDLREDEPEPVPCAGALLVVRIRQDLRRNLGNVVAVCARHKGLEGERRYRERLGDLYTDARRQQGAELAGNLHFRNNVGGFMRGYRRPEKLGPKSSWREPYAKRLRDIWDDGG